MGRVGAKRKKGKHKEQIVAANQAKRAELVAVPPPRVDKGTRRARDLASLKRFAEQQAKAAKGKQHGSAPGAVAAKRRTVKRVDPRLPGESIRDFNQRNLAEMRQELAASIQKKRRRAEKKKEFHERLADKKRSKKAAAKRRLVESDDESSAAAAATAPRFGEVINAPPVLSLPARPSVLARAKERMSAALAAADAPQESLVQAKLGTGKKRRRQLGELERAQFDMQQQRAQTLYRLEKRRRLAEATHAAPQP